IVSRRASPTVAQAGMPLMSVTRIDPAVATFRLKPEEAATLKQGAAVRVIMPASGGEPIDAKVSSVDAQADPVDKTVAAHAQVPNAQGFFKPGMRVEVEFDGPKMQRTYVIPRDALIRDQRDYFVYTVSQGAAHKVQVIPVRTSGEQVEISRGIKDEDMVVVRGQDKLAEGTVVDIWGK
ncbi:MAG: efflux RND transporter periplasmic adaptor subunit, partial [bacterium]